MEYFWLVVLIMAIVVLIFYVSQLEEQIDNDENRSIVIVDCKEDCTIEPIFEEPKVDGDGNPI